MRAPSMLSANVIGAMFINVADQFHVSVFTALPNEPGPLAPPAKWKSGARRNIRISYTAPLQLFQVTTFLMQTDNTFRL